MRPCGGPGNIACLWGPSWKHLEGLVWPPWAGSRHRVNNQLECFSKHADPEPPAASPHSLGGEKSQDPSTRPDI